MIDRQLITQTVLFILVNTKMVRNNVDFLSRGAIVGILNYIINSSQFITTADVLTPAILTLVFSVGDPSKNVFAFILSILILRQLCPQYY